MPIEQKLLNPSPTSALAPRADGRGGGEAEGRARRRPQVSSSSPSFFRKCFRLLPPLLPFALVDSGHDSFCSVFPSPPPPPPSPTFATPSSSSLSFLSAVISREKKKPDDRGGAGKRVGGRGEETGSRGRRRSGWVRWEERGKLTKPHFLSLPRPKFCPKGR